VRGIGQDSQFHCRDGRGAVRPASPPSEAEGIPGSVVDSSGRSWSIAEAEGVVFEVDSVLAADLADAARRLAAEHHSDADIDDHDLLVKAEVAMRRASPELVSELVRFRLALRPGSVMLLRGLPIDDPVPPTPAGGAFAGSWRELAVSTVIELMVMGVLGDVISYADEKDGRLVQDICPVQGAENRQENSGSCLLELHTEDGFHPNKPHFIGLLGLRSDHSRQAMTVASDLRSVLPRLDPQHAQVLREPLFRLRVASSFGGRPDGRASVPAVPVLTGSVSDPDLCVDFHASEPMTELARSALEELRSLMLDSLVGAALEPGDMFIVDNRKAVHGRTGFSPRYDGRDRWLRRCFAVADIRASQPLLFPRSRVHRPLSI
jgi:L-asparagine oxygenase